MQNRIVVTLLGSSFPHKKEAETEVQSWIGALRFQDENWFCRTISLGRSDGSPVWSSEEPGWRWWKGALETPEVVEPYHRDSSAFLNRSYPSRIMLGLKYRSG